MKKLLLVLCLLGFTSFAYAVNTDISGWSFTPVHKTDSSIIGAETDKVVWTPATGRKIVLMGVKFNTDTAGTLLVENGSTAIIPTTECTASGQIVIQSSTPIWEGDANSTLTYTTSVAGRHSILLWGFEAY